MRFDLVIIGDCIEHMRKSDGVDLLNFLMYRSGYICVIYPEAYIQDDWDGHAAEGPYIDLGSGRFQRLEDAPSLMQSNLFLIKGYQPSRLTITG